MDMPKLVDIIKAKSVEIVCDKFGKVWVNVDGLCRLRIGHSECVIIDDPLRGEDLVYGETKDDSE